jgi:glutamate formiminotransferase
MAGPLAACLINISEGRRAAVIQAAVRAATAAIERSDRVEAVVLNTVVDPEYNRTVVTVAGRPASLEEPVVAAARAAYMAIDLARHTGGHPRLGAVDLLAFHPLAEATSVAECGVLARRVATRLAAQELGTSFFYYGGADETGRSLPQRRRELGWFGSRARGAPDLGSASPKAGLTGTGAAPYMCNFNLRLATTRPEVGQAAVERIRESSGGLLGIAAMAFAHSGGTEVACNADMFLLDRSCPRHRAEVAAGRVEPCLGDYWRTRPAAIEQAVAEVAAAAGVAVVADSLVAGIPVERAREEVLAALAGGRPCLTACPGAGART